eukprot:gene57400-biopygen77359
MDNKSAVPAPTRAPTKAPSTAFPNLAVGKTAAQSSFLGAIESNGPVDGDAEPRWARGSCTHTSNAAETGPWWRVDLAAQYSLCTVRAGETEGNGTANHNCGNGGHATVGAGATVDVSCGGQLAR